MQPQWIKKFLILILLSIMLVGCAKESSEADPNIIDLPEQSGGSVPDTDFAMFINQAVSQSDPSPSEEIFFRIVFSREINPATFTTLDLNNLGTSTGALFVITPSADNKIFEVSTNSIATEGTVVLEIPTGAIQDTYGNSNLVNTGIDNSINYSTDLNVIIDQKLGQDDPAGNLPIEFDVNFTSAINDSTFLLDDISLDAASTASGVTWTITNRGDDINYLLTARVVGTPGIIIPIINAGRIENSTNTKFNIASTSTDNSVNYVPNFDMTIEQKSAQNDPASAFPIEFDVVFSEPINDSSFLLGDVTQDSAGTATGVVWTVTHDSGFTNYTIRATSAATEGTIVPSVLQNLIVNGSGKNNTESTSSDNIVDYRLNFYVSIDEGLTQDDPSAVLPIVFDVVFDQEINPATFTDTDINHTGTATGVTWTITNTGDDTNFVLEATVSSEGTLIPGLSVGAVQDKDGLANNFASTSTDNSVSYDTIFDVTIEQKIGQLDPASSLPIEFDVVFSRDIALATFDILDIVDSGTSSGIVWTIINSGDNTNFVIQANGASEGTIIPSLNLGAIQDPTGGNSAASTSDDNSVTYGTTFSVTVEQGSSQVDPAGTLNVEFDVVFSEAIDTGTFDGNDITQNGDAAGVTWNVVHVSGNTNYTLQATIINSAGTLIPSVNATSVQAGAGTKNNLLSTSTDNTVNWFTEFSVTVEQALAQLDPASAFPIVFDVIFERPINDGTFELADITETGSAGNVTWTKAHVSGGTNYIITATSADGAGTIIPSIGAGVVTELIGPSNTTSTSDDNTVTFSPTFDVTINQGTAQTEDPTATQPVIFDVVFTKAINNGSFDGSDIFQGGDAAVTTWTVNHISGNINYTVEASGISTQGTIIPIIQGAKVQTAIGEENTLSTSTDNSVEFVTDFDVTINKQAGQADSTGTLPIIFDVNFERAINNASFVPADISNLGTATVDVWTINHETGNNYFTIRATVITGSGTVIPSISAGEVTETLGSNPNTLSTATNNTVNYFGSPTQVGFIIHPIDTPATDTMTSFTVEIQDSAGNVVGDSTDNVTISFSNDPSAGSATLSGTLTQTAINGVATFNNISINQGQTGFSFVASSGALATNISTAFNITLPAVKLGFQVNPLNSYPNTIINPSVVVHVRDVNNNLVNTAADSITISFQSDPSTGSATLGGTLTVDAVAGVATFGNLTVNEPYAVYTLKVLASGLTNGVSTPFDILPEAPASMVLSSPDSSPDSDSTPTITVGGISSGDIVKVYDGVGCTVEVASYTSTGTTIDVTTIGLSEATHNLYSTRTVNGSISACSTVFVSYQVSGSFSQLDSLDTIGNWSNPGGDDEDWTINTGTTPSVDVGPTAGFGGSGGYAYTEASGISNGDIFYLRSNVVNGSTNPLAISFKWNKRGTIMGDLILEASSNGTSGPWTTVWSHLGTDVSTATPDIWRSQFVDICGLGYTSSTVALRFTASIPTDPDRWHSDMAVDELLIDSGGCVPNPPATADITTPSNGVEIGLGNQSAFRVGGTCSDNGQNIVLSGDVTGTTACSDNIWSIILDLSAHPDGTVIVTADHTSAAGGANGSATRNFNKNSTILQYDNMDSFTNWTNVAGDDGNFQLTEGGTPSINVGPTDDQSGGSYYAFTEASSPIGTNDVFILESNDMPAGTYNLKLDFYWNKRGTNMGDLYLEVSTNGGTSWDITPLWSHIGADVVSGGTDIWNNEVIDVCAAGYSSGNVRFRIRAVMPGSGSNSVWNSDMAVDSLKVTVDGCP